MVMSTFSLSAIEDAVKSKMTSFNDPSHDWHHVVRVRKLARKIAESEIALGKGLDLELVDLAALLHDIADFKFSQENTLELSLSSLGLQDTPFYDALCWIIPRISFRHELAHGAERPAQWINELHVVQDADRLEGIGAIGVVRCFCYSAIRNLPMYDAEQPPMKDLTAEQYNEQARSNKGTSRNHFDEKLVKIKDLMKTTGGEQEALRRHEFMLEFMRQFDLDTMNLS